MSLPDEPLKYPQAVVPIFTTPTPNTVIRLFEGELYLSQLGKVSPKEPGSIDLTWLPSPRVRFTVLNSGFLAKLEDAELHIPKFDETLEVLVTNTHLGSNSQHQYQGILKGNAIIGGNVACTNVLFHIPNFRHFIGDIIRNQAETQSWRGRLRLESKEWLIYIDELQDAKSLFKDIGNDGGFTLTHTGLVQRVDGNTFTYQDVSPVLTALVYFLSFARGIWCGPVLPTGMSNNIPVWQKWSLSHVSPWKDVDTWFPYLEIQDIQNVGKAFDGLLAKLEGSLWSDPIKIAVHWFVESNLSAGGVEGAIVLTQTALELLSWVYLVEDSATTEISPTQFDKLKAAEKIRRLLTRLQVPTTIPPEMTYLSQFAADLGGADGPATIVKLRNGVVHPKQSKRKFVLQTSPITRVEAQQIGLWYGISVTSSLQL